MKQGVHFSRGADYGEFGWRHAMASPYGATEFGWRHGIPAALRGGGLVWRVWFSKPHAGRRAYEGVKPSKPLFERRESI